jgi:pyruvate/2-oxoglutarate dehydrogenase complex dihydrolipoamide acyltransferase (E2) component
MMDVVMRMPDLATVDPTVTVIGWLKEVGQAVERGEPLLEVETDKAILPVESAVSGVLRETAVKAGEEVATGQVIATIVVDQKHEDGAASRPRPVKPATVAERSAPASSSAAPQKSQPAGEQGSSARVAYHSSRGTDRREFRRRRQRRRLVTSRDIRRNSS